MKYKIEIIGEGQEYIVGSVGEELYNFFNNTELSFGAFMDGDLGEDALEDIPESILNDYNFEGASRYEYDNLVHSCGAYFGESTYFTVTDENGNVVYKSNIVSDLGDELEHSSELEDSVDVVNMDSRYVIIGNEHSEGLFNQFILECDDFDPVKLKFLYTDYDETFELITSVLYNNIKLESTGEISYDTSGSTWILRDNETLEEID